MSLNIHRIVQASWVLVLIRWGNGFVLPRQHHRPSSPVHQHHQRLIHHIPSSPYASWSKSRNSKTHGWILLLSTTTAEEVHLQNSSNDTHIPSILTAASDSDESTDSTPKRRCAPSTTTRSARSVNGASSPKRSSASRKNGPSSSSTSSFDCYDFNAQLNELAEQASDPSHNPITSALRVEELWRQGATAISSSRDFQQHSSSTKVLRGDVVSFNTVLKAWRNCGQCLVEHNIGFDASDVASVPVYTAYDAARRALDLLQEQLAVKSNDKDEDDEPSSRSNNSIRVDTTSYNIVMDAFVKSRSPQAVEKVPALFQELQKHQQQQQRPSKDGDATHDNHNPHSNLKPDVLSWNALLDSYAYSDRPDRLVMLQKLLLQMRKGPCKPTVRTINSILHAYSRPTGQSVPPAENRAIWDARAKECESLFQQVKDTYQKTQNWNDHPDVMAYTNLLNIHSRRGSLEATQRADELYNELLQLYQTTKLDRFQPTVYTYTVLILTWARTPVPEAPLRAGDWLNKLLDDPNVKPNTKSYTACIQAWARSSNTARAAKALQLLQQMRSNPLTQPNVVTYLTALDACGMNNGTPAQKTAALKIAFAMFRAAELDSSIIVDHSLYATLLKVVSILLSPDVASAERDDIAAAVFRKACQAGQVNANVIKSLQQATSSSTYQSLLEVMANDHGDIKLDHIPQAWRKNVKPR